MKARRSSCVLAAVLAVLITPVLTWAVPVVGGSTFVANTGEVIATFVGSSAAYTSELFLQTPGNTLAVIFNNHASSPGTSISLGTFAAGTELILGIHVLYTADTFFNGAASRNLDNSAHATVDTAVGLNQSLVGFEDLFGGGDQDYNDLVVSFTNVSSSTIVNPEPTTLVLMASGLAGLLLWRSRSQRHTGRRRGAEHFLKP